MKVGILLLCVAFSEGVKLRSKSQGTLREDASRCQEIEKIALAQVSEELAHKEGIFGTLKGIHARVNELGESEGIDCYREIPALVQVEQGQKQETVQNQKFWGSTPSPTVSGSVYAIPPSTSNSADKFPESSYVNAEDYAVLCSGGGNRALTSNIGQFRALIDLGLENKFGYQSSISGGSWFSSIWMYYKTGARSDGELLGPKTSFADLNLASLEKDPSPLGKTATVQIIPIAQAFSNAGLDADKLWLDSIGEIFLKPFGINDVQPFTLNSETEALIKAANPSFQSTTFYKARDGRPFWICGAATTGPSFSDADENVVSIQTTPLYIGSPFTPNGGPLKFPSRSFWNPITYSRYVGGGFVQLPLGSSDSPSSLSEQQNSGVITVAEGDKPVTIRDAIGWSSMAPGYMLSIRSIDKFNELNPKYQYWPILPSSATSTQSVEEFTMIDGGNLDNTGLIATLQRGASKVVAFMNTPTPLPDTSKYDACSASGLPAEAVYDGSTLGSLFGMKFAGSSSGFFGNNQIFASSEFPRVMCLLQQKKAAGDPTVVQVSLTTLENTWFGIEGGKQVDILIYYLEGSQKFIDQLPADTKAEVEKGARGKFANFPQYDTIGQNSGRVISYTNAQVNLLAAYTEWVVHQTAPTLKAFLGVAN